MLVSTVLEHLADAGVAATYQDATVRTGDGRSLSLRDLAAHVATLPRRRRQAAVRRHLDVVLEGMAVRLPTSLDEVRDLVVARVVGTDDPQEPPAPSWSPRLADGLHLVAALDFPHHLAVLGAERSLDSYGGWPGVAPLAVANLGRLPAPDRVELRGDRRQADSVVDAFCSQDVHGASRLLTLDALLAETVRVERPAHGCLVAVPHRQLLAVHRIEGPGMLGALRLLLRLAAEEHRGAVGAVSPHVYYRSPDGRLDRVGTVGADGQVRLTVSPALRGAMEAVGAQP